VRLYTRRGFDWTDRRPAIADGIAVFVALHCRHRATDAMYAFDLLELDGEDLRPLPLGG
jgi:ATP-dependent DNA ligase